MVTAFAACGVSSSAHCSQTDNIVDLHFIIREGSWLKVENALREEKKVEGRQTQVFGAGKTDERARWGHTHL